MARPTEPGRKHGLRRGMRDLSNLDVSRLIADIKVENHEFIRNVARAKGMPVARLMDEWISRKRAVFALKVHLAPDKFEEEL